MKTFALVLWLFLPPGEYPSLIGAPIMWDMTKAECLALLKTPPDMLLTTIAAEENDGLAFDKVMEHPNARWVVRCAEEKTT